MNGQWQPIETAPKDGTEILVYVEGDMTVAHWCAYISTPQWRDAGDMGLSGMTDVEPSHWMPLPEAPTS